MSGAEILAAAEEAAAGVDWAAAETAGLLVLLALLLPASGFCSGVELGFLTVSRPRLVSLVRQGGKRAKRLAKTLADMPRVMTTLLVGNNIVNVLISTVSATLGLRLFETAAGQAGWSCGVALAVVFCGEYLPKLLFATRPMRRSLAAVGAYRAMAAVLAPVVAVFHGFVKMFYPKSGGKGEGVEVSRDGLRKLMAAKDDSTRLTQFERRLIERVLTLQARVAGDMARPLAEDPYRTALAQCRTEEYTPVAPELWRRRVPDAERLRIGAGTRGDDILPAMRRSRQATALVVDEATGEDIGVITEEDVLQAVFGY